MKLQLYQERVTPTGGQKSEGVQNVLGRPPMNWITVVLREAVQNSWDARKGNKTVSFDVRWHKPTSTQRRALYEQVFDSEPGGSRIRAELQRENFQVLIFTDRGTSGLSGPIPANEESTGGEKRNFVDFVWDIGRSEEAGAGGGTYGYGKTSFYQLSKVRTVCIHSRCMWQGSLQDRFIAAHLGRSSPRLTGRFWWGDVQDRIVRPVLGSSAARVAAAIGMPEFPQNECGTSIMMLSPRVEVLARDEETSAQPDVQEAIKFIGESLVHWFWPKMVSVDGSAEMRFRIFHDGKEIPVPSPDSLPPYNVYCEALRHLKDKSQETKTGATQRPIECLRPRASLGHLVMVKGLKKKRVDGSGDFGEASARELFHQAHHVVLLRKPLLVVKYLAGRVPPDEQLDCAGVFVVDSEEDGGEVEKAFALSEPPTHDDWVPATLTGASKTYVNVALRRIKDAFNEFCAPITAGAGAGPQNSLGAFSEMLGDLLSGSSDGTGARVQPGPAPNRNSGAASSGTRRSRIDIIGDARLLEKGGKRFIVVPFRVTAAKGAEEVRIRADPVVILEQGGVEKEAPGNAAVPKIHSFVHIQNGEITSLAHNGESATIPASMTTDSFAVQVELASDSRVRVDLSVE